MDTFSRKKRSEIMSKVRSSNTAPELLVRRLLHRDGFRFRLYGNDLPGNPDIILPKYRTVILVHGCFWHRHKNCAEASMPQSNVEYWEKKFDRNVRRDRRIKRELSNLGWRVITIWECQTKKRLRLLAKFRRILTPKESSIAAEAPGLYNPSRRR
jgi:DNA mismatch endonuclease (patch repair protein)